MVSKSPESPSLPETFRFTYVLLNLVGLWFVFVRVSVPFTSTTHKGDIQAKPTPEFVLRVVRGLFSLGEAC